MIVSDRYKFIFGGIGRSGATSIHAMLFKYHNEKSGLWKHVPFSVAAPIIPGFYDYYRFCVFRNPWDLAVSKYFYHGGRRCRHRDGYGGIPVCKNAREMSFLEWVKVPEHLYLVYETPVMTFREFVLNEKGDVLVNGVFNFSNLVGIPKLFRDRFGLVVTLPHLNKTKHSLYCWHYLDDTEAIDVVQRRFSWAIDKFGFSFSGGEEKPFVSFDGEN